jgi:hypothetical protein
LCAVNVVVPQLTSKGYSSVKENAVALCFTTFKVSQLCYLLRNPELKQRFHGCVVCINMGKNGGKLSKIGQYS